MAPIQSFVPVERDSHFPIQNIPFGVFSTPENVEYATRVIQFPHVFVLDW